MTTTSTTTIRELTIRSVVLGGLITLVFTAANVYLGLKVGLTFATVDSGRGDLDGDPALFRGHSILENNIVQTVASAAGTLSAIIFVLPGLVMIGWWQGFPFWTTFLVCALGGMLGVMFSMPLRRALVDRLRPALPRRRRRRRGAESRRRHGRPRRRAEGNRRACARSCSGAVAAAGFSCWPRLELVGSEVRSFFRVGSGAHRHRRRPVARADGRGHLVGISVGIAMLVGLLISCGVAAADR